MTQQTTERNPFLLMINPEVVLAAVEKSVRLSQLNRHLCRPLDRDVSPTGNVALAADANDTLNAIVTCETAQEIAQEIFQEPEASPSA
jgi:hypothetical protein